MKCYQYRLAGLMLAGLASIAMAQVPYSQPFPGTINSPFGPRNDNSPFHGGLDFKQTVEKPIPATAAGSVNEIRTDLNAGGIRMYLTTADISDLGYMHLFSYIDPVRNSRSGKFVLLKQQPYVMFLPTAGTRFPGLIIRCDTILNTQTAVALVPGKCASIAAGLLALDRQNPSKLYTVTNQVKSGIEIAPVGDSAATNCGKKGCTTPNQLISHLHIQWGRLGTVKHPLKVLQDIAPIGQFCARLATTGTKFPYSGTPDCSKTPPIETITTGQSYLDVRIDSANRVDLDGAAFKLSSNPTNNYSIQYSHPNRLINGNAADIDDIKAITNLSLTCNVIPSPGDFNICPSIWGGQPSSPLQQVFRLGFDATQMATGCNKVDVEMYEAKRGKLYPGRSGVEKVSLPFIYGAPRPPIAVSDTASTTPGTAVTINVLANDTDASGAPIKEHVTITGLSVPLAQGTVTPNSDGTITFTPAAGFTGLAQITYKLITDCGNESNAASVMVNVTNTVVAPSITLSSANCSLVKLSGAQDPNNCIAPNGLDYCSYDWRLTESGTASGPVGWFVDIHNNLTLSTQSYGFRSVSCGNWSAYIVPGDPQPRACIRENGQPDSTSWTISGTLLQNKSNIKSLTTAYAELRFVGNYALVRSNSLQLSCK